MRGLNRYFLPRQKAIGFGPTLETWHPEHLAQFTNGIATPELLLSRGEVRAALFEAAHRNLLVETIGKQYTEAGSVVPHTLENLASNRAVTITTGHQLSLALGPLFVVYKILHTVVMCEFLNQKQHGLDFIPVFWLATEDHDLEEIQNVHFFNKSVTWHPEEGGPVGRMPAHTLVSCYAQITSYFSEETKKELEEIFSVSKPTYGQHYHQMLSKIFGKYGVILVDGDDPALKRRLVPLMVQEVETQFLESTVAQTNAALEKAEKRIQAMVRPINLFYLSPGKRERIIPKTNGFTAGETFWNKEGLLRDIQDTPERFSPNVIMRPLYQELILPNVCYVGGSGELNYWAQLKKAFTHAGVPFPLLKTRFSGFILKSFDEEELVQGFTSIDDQIDAMLSKESSRDRLFQELQQAFDALEKTMQAGVKPFGKEGEKWSMAQIKAIESAMEQYKSRWQRQEKQQLDTSIQRLRRKYAERYPQEQLPQERQTSILHYCDRQLLSELIDQLKQQIDCFTEDVHVFSVISPL